MSDEAVSRDQTAEDGPQIDPVQLEFALQTLRSEQNMFGAVLAGVASALVGAGLWAGLTIAIEYQIGWMAIGVGFLVGFSVRLVGKGVDRLFGIIGATFALLACATGNLLSVCGMVAGAENMAFLEVLSRLDLAIIAELMMASFSPIDLLFYGIAIYEGYKLSFRQLSQQELSSLLPGQ